MPSGIRYTTIPRMISKVASVTRKGLTPNVIDRNPFSSPTNAPTRIVITMPSTGGRPGTHCSMNSTATVGANA